MSLSNQERFGVPEDLGRALDRELNYAGTEVVNAAGALSVLVSHTNLAISGTMVFTLAAPRFVGQRKTIRVSSAASTPVGSISGAFQNAGANVGTIAGLDAVTDFVELEAISLTRWNVVNAVGVTFS